MTDWVPVLVMALVVVCVTAYLCRTRNSIDQSDEDRSGGSLSLQSQCLTYAPGKPNRGPRLRSANAPTRSCRRRAGSCHNAGCWARHGQLTNAALATWFGAFEEPPRVELEDGCTSAISPSLVPNLQ
jgi:hypothetical protein